MSFAVAAFLLFVGSFLLGSIPWGVLVSRGFYHTDVREHGSGNIGTTNAFRAMGKVGGALVFLLDFGKGILSGVLALFVCSLLGDDMVSPVAGQTLLALAFLGCIWGHVFSPWLRFKGGKGVAVAIGCMFVSFGPVPSLIEIAVFVLCVVFTRKVSVGSLAAAAACPFIALYVFWGNWPAWVMVLVAAVTVIWAHRSNISRLCAGNESSIGRKGKSGRAE